LLGSIFEQKGSIEDQNDGVEMAGRAVEAALSINNTGRLDTYLRKAYSLMQMRYEQTEDTKVWDESIGICNMALRLVLEPAQEAKWLKN
jgi:hypothetical protein